MQKKGIIKSIAYLIGGVLLYAITLYKTTNTGDVFTGITPPPTQYWVAVGVVGTIFIAGIVTVYVNRYKLSTFYLARAIGFWLIQIPLLSMLSFFFIEQVFGFDNSIGGWLLWIKAMIPPALLFITMISSYVKNWKGNGGESLAKKFDVMGNTSMRIMSWALFVSFGGGIIGALTDNKKPLYITLMILQWTGTILISARNGIKIYKENYNNIFLGWIDPALPHTTLITVFWWTIAGALIPVMEGSWGLQRSIIIYNAIGFGLGGLMVSIHVIFKVSLWKILILDNPIMVFYSEAIDSDNLKLKDLNPWKVIKNYFKYRRNIIEKRKNEKK